MRSNNISHKIILHKWEFLTYIGFICFYLTEILRLLINNTLGSAQTISIGSYLRGFIFALFLAVCWHKRKTDYTSALLIFAFAISIMIGRFYSFGIENLTSFINSYGRYLAFFIFLYYFNNVIRLNRIIIIRCSLVIISIGIFDCLLSLIGIIYNIDIFRTYTPARFGFNGAFYWPNDATSFFMLLTTLSLFLYIKHQTYYIFFFLTFAAFGVLIGTKAFVLFLLGILLIMSFIIKPKNHFAIICLVLFILTASFIGYEYYSTLATNSSWIFSLSSGRNTLIKQAVVEITNFDVFQLIFGIAEIKLFLTETDIIDLFIFSGVIGATIYGTLIIKMTGIRKNKYTSTMAAMLILILSVGALAGHIIGNGTISIYWAFIVSIGKNEYWLTEYDQ